MSRAWAISRATEVLASKLCGSADGLFTMAETLTKAPPIWDRTSAYWVSAPTTAICPGPAWGMPQAPAASAPRASAGATSTPRHIFSRTILDTLAGIIPVSKAHPTTMSE